MALMKNINVEFISLVRKGANRKKILWKSAENPQEQKQIPIAKTDEEKHLVYGVVYAPNEIDSQGDYTTAEEIEKAAHNFMKEGRVGNIDRHHSFAAEDGAFVAESWIIKAGDPVFPDEKEGAWAISVKIEDEELWEEVKKQEIGGLSIGGMADKIEKASDFNSHFNRIDLWQLWDALRDSIDEVLKDLDAKDRKAAIAENLDQFRKAVLDNVLIKSLKQEVAPFTGAGVETKQENFPREKGSVPLLGTWIDTIKKRREKMDEKDVRRIAGEVAKEVLAKSEAPTKEEIVNDVVKGMKDVITPLEERLVALEKSTPGSGQEDDPADENTDFAKIASEIVKAYKGE